jgi:hypothetical protein
MKAPGWNWNIWTPEEAKGWFGIVPEETAPVR